MAHIDRRRFDSAQSAFDALGGDNVPFANLARKKLVHIGTALSTKDPFCRRGGYFPNRGSLHHLMSSLLLNGKEARLSSKTWKCIKIKDSDDVCFYSDSYHIDIDKANKLDALCRGVGLDLRIFEWDYPPREKDKNDRYPSKTVRIIGGGYKQLSRGKLVGFVVGAYNNSFDALEEKNKRKRE